MKKQRLFALIMALAMLLTLAPTAATATAVGADYCPASATGGHNWVWEEHEPTCTEDGYACMRCSLCGATTDYDPIGALGHSPLSVDAKEPTCEESGWHAGARCSRCGATLQGLEYIPPIGHKWDNGVVTKPARTRLKR